MTEDLQNNRWLTKDVGAGGARFSAQWDAMFVHPIRRAVITPRDEQRSLAAIRDAICYRYMSQYCTRGFRTVLERLQPPGGGCSPSGNTHSSLAHRYRQSPSH